MKHILKILLFCVYASAYATADDVLKKAVQSRMDEKLEMARQALNPRSDQTKPANPNLMIDGTPAISLAIIYTNPNIVRVLLNAAGININQQDLNSGNTPLVVAVHTANPKFVAMILGKKPNLEIKNKQKDTALAIAKRRAKDKSFMADWENYQKIVDMLKQAGAKK